MKSYEYLKGIVENNHPQARWRYVGPGYGQGLFHFIALLEPHEVVTCSNSHGYLGTPEDFVKHFQLV
jgi:hypothetical protein